MKVQNSKKMFLTTLATLGMMVCFGQSNLTWANDNNSGCDSSMRTKFHKHLKKAFKLGVCVGQALAADGVKISIAEMQRPSSIDSETREKIKEQVRACHQEMKNTESSTQNPTRPRSPSDDSSDPEME